jgi:hypothetical protein
MAAAQSLGRFLIMERTAPTNLPRRGFFLEITELLNVEVLARLLGSFRASVPQGLTYVGSAFIALAGSERDKLRVGPRIDCQF